MATSNRCLLVLPQPQSRPKCVPRPTLHDVDRRIKPVGIPPHPDQLQPFSICSLQKDPGEHKATTEIESGDLGAPNHVGSWLNRRGLTKPCLEFTALGDHVLLAAVVCAGGPDGVKA